MEDSNLSNEDKHNNNAHKMAELNLALLRRNIGSLERNSFTSRGFTLCHLNNVSGNVTAVKITQRRNKGFHVYFVHDAISTAEVM
jgi:hypothetical protein